MRLTTFHIPGMDCPSEERIIRLKLEGRFGIELLRFNLKSRCLDVYHRDLNEKVILGELDDLNMGAVMFRTMEVDEVKETTNQHRERSVLWIVLAINLLFFAGEMLFGLISGSMGLVADSLDMLADSFVYALALMTVGAALRTKKRVAKISGYLQLLLALIGFGEVIRRFIGAEIIPDFRIMMMVSALALVANVICLALLYRVNSKDAHMQASMIFTSNDIAINLGVIVAGGLVWFLETPIPDLIVGSIVFLIVMRGAWRILALAR